MKTIFYILLLSSLFAFSQSCDTSKKAIKSVDADKISQTYKVKMGDTLRIKLSSNASTGYKWQLASKIKPKVIKFENRKYTNNDKSMRIGGGGTDTWNFSTLKTGKVFILMKYMRGEELKKEKYIEINVVE